MMEYEYPNETKWIKFLEIIFLLSMAVLEYIITYCIVFGGYLDKILLKYGL